MRQHFRTSQWLPYPVEPVFAFFANPENLPRLMPHWQAARIEEATFCPPPPRPEGSPRLPGIAAGSGTRLTITARPFPYSPLRLPWVAVIEDFRWNEGFCDVQERGPFNYWRHCHSVRAADDPATGRPGCTVADHVEYEPPLGALGALGAAPALRYVFRYRQKRTSELLARMQGVPVRD